MSTLLSLTSVRFVGKVARGVDTCFDTTRTPKKNYTFTYIPHIYAIKYYENKCEKTNTALSPCAGNALMNSVSADGPS